MIPLRALSGLAVDFADVFKDEKAMPANFLESPIGIAGFTNYTEQNSLDISFYFHHLIKYLYE